MYLVALASFRGDPETEAAPLAKALETALYDARSYLHGALPRVVFRSEDAAAAGSVLKAIAALGHGALCCHSSEILPTSSMPRVKRFRLDALGISPNGQDADAIGWEEIAAIIHVVQRTTLERTTVERVVVQQYRGAPRSLEQEQTRREHEAEHALYLFLRNGQPPWCLREHDARYLGLGDQMRATSRENFTRTMSLIRGRAKRAVFDDRFASAEMPAARNVVVRGHGRPEPTAAQPRESDLVVHLLATWLTTDVPMGYRTPPDASSRADGVLDPPDR